MIIADELEADWDQLEIIQAPAAEEFKNPILRNQLTVASASVRGFYWPLRKAGAAGRAVLIEAADSQLSTDRALELLRTYTPRVSDPGQREVSRKYHVDLLEMLGRTEQALALLRSFPQTPRSSSLF